MTGTYAAASLMPGDYILPNKVSSSPLSSDPALYSIPDGMVAISVTTQTLATALSDKLQSGDIIRFYHYNDEHEQLNPRGRHSGTSLCKSSVRHRFPKDLILTTRSP